MAAVLPVPFALKNSTVKVGADNYEASVSACLFTPTAVSTIWKGLTPTAIFPVAGNTTWTCQVDYPQDWATATSFSNYLLNNAGSTVIMDFYPIAGGKGYRASVVLREGPIGGQIDATAVGSVTLDVIGKPVLITP